MNNSNLDNKTKSPNSDNAYEKNSLKDFRESEISSTRNIDRTENSSIEEQLTDQRNKVLKIILNLKRNKIK